MTGWVTYVPAPVDAAALQPLSRLGPVLRGYGDNPVAWKDAAAHTNAVLLRSTRFGGDDFDLAPNLRIVARHGVGVDTVDVAAARERGVAVTVTAGANAISVAEHTVALMLAVSRRIRSGVTAVANGRWARDRPSLVGTELSGACAGLLGFGRIGRRVASILSRGFGMTVSVHDPGVDPSAISELAHPATFEEVVARAHVLSLHLPLTEDTRHIVDAATLARLPRGAILINTSRGGLVDEDALLAALDDGHLAGAGLDVVEGEPVPAGHPLTSRPDVVVTPHIAGQTAQAMRRVAQEAVASIVACHDGRPIPGLVS